MSQSTEDYYFIGVDVGTGSVRAGLFNQYGLLITSSTQPLEIWNPKADYYEQSSVQIWAASCQCVKDVSRNVDPHKILGLGFDATCSLVVIGANNQSLSASPTGLDNQNVIMWMDHRAVKETEAINVSVHEALKFVGGAISVEMQLPKLLWIKNNLPEIWSKAELFFDLPDFLTWKATGSEDRSQCSTVCKWNYVVDHDGVKGWQLDLLKQIGLEDLPGSNNSRIGQVIKSPGLPQGKGLTDTAASAMGLLPGTPVGVSLIDAYAGTLGTLGCRLPADTPIHRRLVSVCGTSTCHMSVSRDPIFVSGVWGPYNGVLLANQWLLEAGQSATGKLIDHVITTHPAAAKLAEENPALIPEQLKELLEDMARDENCRNIDQLTRNLHVWPDFHGNRSPLADFNLKGMICGLTLDTSEKNLARQYLATIQALCYGTRHISDAFKDRGVTIECVLVCGGLSKNTLFVSTLASVLVVPVVIPEQQEPVLLGAAMLGACASAKFQSLEEAMERMAGSGTTVLPNPDVLEFHEKKYQVFLKMYQDQRFYDSVMNSIPANP